MVAGGPTFGVIDGKVVRIDRSGVSHSLDFDTMGQISTSRSRFDEVMWSFDGRTNEHPSGQPGMWRARLDGERLDAPVEDLSASSVRSDQTMVPLVFDNGDRAVVLSSSSGQVTVRRLVRAGVGLGVFDSTDPVQ